jgi:DNA end-binding protein Ku
VHRPLWPRALRKKQKGEKIERPREPARTNVVNLMEALRQSVKAAGGKQASATRAPSKKGKKRIEGQREMLLPIPGKKDKENRGQVYGALKWPS